MKGFSNCIKKFKIARNLCHLDYRTIHNRIVFSIFMKLELVTLMPYHEQIDIIIALHIIDDWLIKFFFNCLVIFKPNQSSRYESLYYKEVRT